MKILVIGAGAVGLVYGYALAESGAEVSFFVKEKYVEDAQKGFTLYPLNKGRDPKPVHWQAAQIYSDVLEVAKSEWEQIWICTSTTALRAGWLPEFAEKVQTKHWVALQPGLDDRIYLLEHIREEQLIQGVISFISYQTPLKTETRSKPGIAYWFPPMGPSPFSGVKKDTKALIRQLKKGGCPATYQKDAAGSVAFLSATLMCILILLESESWSFTRFKRSPNMQNMIYALHEALTVVSHFRKESRPLWRWMIRGSVLRWVLWLSTKVIPIDIETYFQYHFTKVGDQTRFMIQTYIDNGRTLQLPVDQLEHLLALVPSSAK